MTKQGPDFAEDIARLNERGEIERLRAALAKSEAQHVRDVLLRGLDRGVITLQASALQAADAYAAGVEEMRNGGVDIATMDDLRANWIACRAKVPA